MKRRSSLNLFLTATLLLSTHPGYAQDASDKAAAEALFEQARELLAAGKMLEACKRFEASQKLDAGLGTLLHLADCYERADMRASAWATFEEAASLARGRGDEQRAEVASVRAAALRPQLAFIQLDLPAATPPGLEITRNGRVISDASWGVPVPVDSGMWKIVARAAGFQDYSVNVEVKYGSPEPHHVAIPELSPLETGAAGAPQAPVQEAPRSDSSPKSGADITVSSADSTQTTVGLIVGGAGVVALGVAGVFTGLAISNNQRSIDACSPEDPNACGQDGKRLRDTAIARAGVASVLGIVGTVALAGGTVIYLTAPNPTQSESVAGIGVRGVW